MSVCYECSRAWLTSCWCSYPKVVTSNSSTPMTRDEKIKRIYEVISDKTLSFWCIIKSHHNRKPKTWSWLQYTNDIFVSKWLKNYYYWSCPVDDEYIWKPRYKSDSIEIIWHPVMIWDLLDWAEKKSKENKEFLTKFTDKNCYICWIWIELHNMFTNWEYTREPIEKQSDKCIDYIYSLTF